MLSIGDKHFLGICLLLPARNPLRVGEARWKKFTCGSNTSGGSTAGPRPGQHTARESNATFELLESGTVVPKKRSWVSSKLISRQLIFKVDMYLVFTAEFEPPPSHPLPLPSVKATLWSCLQGPWNGTVVAGVATRTHALSRAFQTATSKYSFWSTRAQPGTLGPSPRGPTVAEGKEQEPHKRFSVLLHSNLFQQRGPSCPGCLQVRDHLTLLPSFLSHSEA